VLTYTQTTTSVHTSARTVAKASIERKNSDGPYIASRPVFLSSTSSQAIQQYCTRTPKEPCLRLLGEFLLTLHTSDLLNRHRASHENAEQGERSVRRRTEKACQACIRSKTKCEEERPCKVGIPPPKRARDHMPSTNLMGSLGPWKLTQR
jgi:hypothetical protein